MHSSIESQIPSATPVYGVDHVDAHSSITLRSSAAAEYSRRHCRATTINAAFLHEIKIDDIRLKRLLIKLEAFAKTRPFRLGRLPSLAKLLRNFSDQLAFHFALEEAYGYFDATIEDSPQLSSQADRLRAQHVHLFDQACYLAGKAEEMAKNSPCLRAVDELHRDAQDLLARLQAHERAENSLILDALNVDLGTGD